MVLATLVSTAGEAHSLPIHLSGVSDDEGVREAIEAVGIRVRDGRDELLRSSCAARELVLGQDPVRKLLSRAEMVELGQTSLSAPTDAIDGLNVSVRCQMAYFASDDVILRVFPVSTGKLGHRTPRGLFKRSRSIDGWHISTLYPGARMYRPMYFNGPVAVHGSGSDSSVRSFPASHGCVRTRHADVDWLWRHWPNGSKVRVYGTW